MQNNKNNIKKKNNKNKIMRRTIKITRTTKRTKKRNHDNDNVVR